jgi:UDP-3-O-[3-hydroxymyristoyl] N-acetylglucosamine deacetylase
VTQPQHTLRAVLEFAGVGLHTGADARLRIYPQPPETGLVFQLGTDGPLVPALAEHVAETRRATVLGNGEATVSTVEHVLSALFALGVDNALLEIEGPEIPVLDGSAEAFAAAIARIGLLEQDRPRRRFVVERPQAFQHGESRLIALPSDEFRVVVCVDFPPPVGAQFFAGAIEPESYRDEIAPARTFGYLREVEALRAAGLARGGSLDNALVFAENGPLTPLRWPNEVVRHKVLDLIGDLALLGAFPQGEFVSIKSGHRLHATATRALRQAFAAPAPVGSC